MKYKNIIICGIFTIILGAGTIYINKTFANDQMNQNSNNSVQINKENYQYESYTALGLIYNKDEDRFYYKDQLVRTLIDKKGDFYYTYHSKNDGELDLQIIRDDKNKILKVSVASQEEYNKRTQDIQNSNLQVEEAIKIFLKENPSIDPNADFLRVSGNIIGSTEEYLNYLRSYKTVKELALESVKPYLQYGINYDDKLKNWSFNGKPVRILSDGENLPILNNSDNAVKNGISLKVIRNSNNEIEKIVEMSEKEINSLVVFN